MEDYYPQNKRWWLRLHEKNGKLNEMPCLHKLEYFTLDVLLGEDNLVNQNVAVAILKRDGHRPNWSRMGATRSRYRSALDIHDAATFGKLGKMNAAAPFRLCAIVASLAAGLFAGEPTQSGDSWTPKAAAAYLDGRLAWWMEWQGAVRDRGTFCISCHTAAPYALARPALRTTLGEQGPSPVERKLLDNVTKRVRMWAEVAPFYPDKKPGDPKTLESRGTESILNALVLVASQRAERDRAAPELDVDARLALDNMWAQQLKDGETKGAWPWLQFHNAPWEGDSQYYGAALAAVVVGMTPESYRSTPKVQDGVNAMREYLAKNRESQTLMDRMILLWASARLPGLLTRPQQDRIIGEALNKQQDDGGFSLSSFVGGWKRKDNTPLETKSDGYATGVVTLALQETGVDRDRAAVQRALAWMNRNQQKTDGRWLAYSLNKQRDLESDIGRFMSDAATAYSVLALQRAK